MIVTDMIGYVKSGRETKGFYMDRYLKENLEGIPAFIKKDWDVVGIISGSGLVRVGKSRQAIQVGAFIAWSIAGGKVIADENGNAIKVIPPKKDLNFSLDNVVFSPEELMEKARKFPKNSVFIYDEGRAGLDSKRAMESINKGMEDFFQECGVYNHVILIVLPDFFKLHYDYSITRSMFLIDVNVNKKWERGFFKFYNRNQKEWLFNLGKKKMGVIGKYSAASCSFYGRFTSWFPFSDEEYNARKKAALEKKEITRFQKRYKRQRDVALYLYKKKTKKTNADIAEEMSEVCEFEIKPQVIKEGILDIQKRKGEFKEYKELKQKVEQLMTMQQQTP